MQRINIQRQAGVVQFNPADQLVDITTDGGAFIFENQDHIAHQPKPSTGTWVEHPIDPGKPSTLIAAQNPGRYPYTCALHPGEQGCISAPNVITIQTQLIDTGFNPASQSVTPAADSGLVVFLNLDQTASHRPVPDDTNTPPWFQDDIQPAAYSPVITVTTPGTYSYHCAIHPDEKGTIVVSAPSPT